MKPYEYMYKQNETVDNTCLLCHEDICDCACPLRHARNRVEETHARKKD